MTRSRRALLTAILSVGIAQFVVLGPGRAFHGGVDLAAPYAATRAWFRGLDPYDASVVAKVLADAGRETAAQPAFTPSLYPPPTFVAMLPFAALPWPAARATWIVVTLVTVGFALAALARLAASGDGFGRFVVMAAALSLAPFATGVALGQPAILSVAATILGLERGQRGSRGLAVALLLAALLLKPQIAGPLILLAAIRGPREPARFALAAFAMITAITVTSVQLRSPHWLSSWRHNAQLELHGGNIDPRSPVSAQMVDPRPLITAVAGADVSMMWSGVVALAAAALVVASARRVRRDADLLVAANVAVLTLFIGYHRFYDAAILCLPLAWAIAEIQHDGHRRREAILSLLCLAPFAASGAWTLQRWANAGIIPEPLASSTFWDVFVLRHQIWALLALQSVLLLALRATQQASDGARRDFENSGDAIQPGNG